nr:hypothetical protein [Kibdelosporangium sp. MJ126-NF4]CTQ94030.1 hypothetical protein [Kibdelosporangium sp. MJ126-NF4]
MVVGRGRVVVVVGAGGGSVVFVTSWVVVTTFWVVVVVVVLSGGVSEAEDDELDVVLDDELCEVWSGAAGAFVVDGGREAVLSVATCSSLWGARSAAFPVVAPTANKAATAAPRNAPTAIRNGAPRVSSTELPLSG